MLETGCSPSIESRVLQKTGALSESRKWHDQTGVTGHLKQVEPEVSVDVWLTFDSDLSRRLETPPSPHLWLILLNLSLLVLPKTFRLTPLLGVCLSIWLHSTSLVSSCPFSFSVPFFLCWHKDILKLKYKLKRLKTNSKSIFYYLKLTFHINPLASLFGCFDCPRLALLISPLAVYVKKKDQHIYWWYVWLKNNQISYGPI